VIRSLKRPLDGQFRRRGSVYGHFNFFGDRAPLLDLTPHIDDAYARAAKATTVPIAAGENHYTRFGFQRLFDQGAVQIMQPDISKSKGITEVMRIAAMARQGRAGVALFMTAVASFVGGCVALLAVFLVAPSIVRMALSFGAPEYFSMMLLGLVAAAAAASGDLLRSIDMVLPGLLMGLVGTDIVSGARHRCRGFSGGTARRGADGIFVHCLYGRKARLIQTRNIRHGRD